MDTRGLFVVQPYHPDLLRCPDPLTSRLLSDRTRHALTWNVFRTLEQTAPSVWLRFFVARLAGLTDGGAGAPHTVRVSCWTSLPPSPRATLRRGRRVSIPVDVLVETETAAVALAVPPIETLTSPLLSDTQEGSLYDMAEAAMWFAGRRAAFVGIILPLGTDEEVWKPRVRRRGAIVSHLLDASAPGTNLQGVGAMSWRDLDQVLEDVTCAASLPEAERRRAGDTLTWMRRTTTVPARRDGLLHRWQTARLARRLG